MATPPHSAPLPGKFYRYQPTEVQIRSSFENTGLKISIISPIKPGSSEYSGFRRDIQGLRGVAVLLVVLYHAGIPLFTAGFVGVDVFFVISGYLITGLLVREMASTGHLRFMRFYARRILRLLPAALVVIMAVLALVRFFYAPLEQGEFFSACRAAAIYLVNFWFAGRAVDYLGGDAEANPILHMWSLAVEEQFYLVWPLLIATAARVAPEHRRSRLIFVVTAVSLVSFVFCLWMTWRSQPSAFFGMPFRAWEFGLGALVCLFEDKARGLSRRVLTVVGIVGSSTVLLSTIALDQSSLFPGAWALLPAGGAALMIVALQTSASQGNSGLSVWLSTRPLARIGDLSYSWYLWHWPVLVFAAAAFPTRGVFVTSVALAASLALAEISYRFIENPIRHSRKFAGRDARTIVLALVISGGVAAIGTGLKFDASSNEVSAEQRAFAAARDDTPNIYKTGCYANFDTIEMPACIYGRPDSKVTVVLFGDSHAAHWFPALERLAIDRNWRLVPITKSSCPSIDVKVFNSVKKRLYFECHEWRIRMMSRIANMKPDLVVLSNSHRYNSDAIWAAGATRTIQRLADLEIPVAIIRDIPHPGFHGPACLARMTWMKRNGEVECTFHRDEVLARGFPVWQAELHTLTLYPRGLAIDLTKTICPQNLCGVAQNGTVHFSDTNHITASYAASLAPNIDANLQEWANRADSPIRKLMAK